MIINIKIQNQTQTLTTLISNWSPPASLVIFCVLWLGDLVERLLKLNIIIIHSLILQIWRHLILFDWSNFENWKICPKKVCNTCAWKEQKKNQKLCVCRRCFCVINKPKMKFLSPYWIHSCSYLTKKKQNKRSIFATKFIHKAKLFSFSFLIIENKNDKKKVLDDKLQKLKWDCTILEYHPYYSFIKTVNTNPRKNKQIYYRFTAPTLHLFDEIYYYRIMYKTNCNHLSDFHKVTRILY